MLKRIQLSSGFFVLLFLGVAYAWSIFVQPLEDEFGWQRDQTSMVFMLSQIFFNAGAISGGILNSRFNHRIIMISAGIFMAFGFFCSSNVTELWHLYISYGVICSMCTGMLYNVVITTVNTWFTNIGFSSGVLLMGYGFGGFLLGSFISFCNESLGWRTTFLLLAVFFAAVVIICAVLLKENKNINSMESQVVPREGQITPLEMLRKKSFHIYYLWGVCITSLGLAVIGHATLIAATFDMPSFMPVLAAGILSIANGISRIIFGIVYDKSGRRITMLSIALIMTCGVIMISLSLLLDCAPLIFAAYTLIGCGYGAYNSCTSAFTKEYFGHVNYGRNFSIICSAGIWGSFLGAYILGVLMKFTGSYLISCCSFYIFAISIIILQFALTRYTNKISRISES